jgi:CMP/dCMP kinase
VIAIDGPSASGKGTVAQLVADQLGFHYLDSGALYRIVALAAKRMGISWQADSLLEALTQQLTIEFKQGEIYLNGDMISEQIRSEEIGRGASEVAVHNPVRGALLNLQHSFCQAPGLVADGRDMASVVFPDAALKIFYLQLKNKGLNADYAQILADLQQRDLRDSARSAAPLMQMPEALLLDTTQRSIQQAVDFVLNAYQKSNLHTQQKSI